MVFFSSCTKSLLIVSLVALSLQQVIASNKNIEDDADTEDESDDLDEMPRIPYHDGTTVVPLKGTAILHKLSVPADGEYGLFVQFNRLPGSDEVEKKDPEDEEKRLAELKKIFTEEEMKIRKIELTQNYPGTASNVKLIFERNGDGFKVSGSDVYYTLQPTDESGKKFENLVESEVIVTDKEGEIQPNSNYYAFHFFSGNDDESEIAVDIYPNGQERKE